MTHTFDSEVSLHYWLLWPKVHRAHRVVYRGILSHHDLQFWAIYAVIFVKLKYPTFECSKTIKN